MSYSYKGSSALKSSFDYIKEYELLIEGFGVYLTFSKHASRRSQSRQVSEATVLSMTKDAFDDLFNLENGDIFTIVDHDLKCSYIGAFHAERGEFYIDVITIINKVSTYTRKGTVIIDIN